MAIMTPDGLAHAAVARETNDTLGQTRCGIVYTKDGETTLRNVIRVTVWRRAVTCLTCIGLRR